MDQQKRFIINAAIDLFAKCGISGVSIQDIADAIKASRGKIYHHFKGGKSDIITAILQSYEDCLHNTLPDPSEWKSKDADARQILSKLFSEFPAEDALRLRKIIRIILAEMYYDKQIAQYAKEFLIVGREKLLADCFRSLAENGKIIPIDTDSAARFFNRLFIVYGIEDALCYPYSQDENVAHEQNERTFRDYNNFLKLIMGQLY